MLIHYLPLTPYLLVYYYRVTVYPFDSDYTYIIHMLKMRCEEMIRYAMIFSTTKIMKAPVV